jgi:hypothetical protein
MSVPWDKGSYLDIARVSTLGEENKERNCLPECPVLSFVQAGEPAVEAGDLTVGN